MFNNCINLLSLDLSKFDTSSVKAMEYMFNNCKSLVYLNIYLFKKKSNINTTNTFKNINQNVKYCIREPNQFSIQSECENICFKNRSKIIVNLKTCIENCSDDKTYKYEYNKFCYESCPNYTYNSPNNKYICEEKNNEALQTNILFKTNLLLSNIISSPCYKSCKSCYGFGNEINNNCVECNSGFKFLDDSKNEYNCYLECKYYYYFDNLNRYFCTENSTCPNEYNKLLIDKKSCVKDCRSYNKYEYYNICYDECPPGTEIINGNDRCSKVNDEMNISSIISIVKNDIINKDNIIKNFQDDIINHRLDELLFNITVSKKDFHIIEDNVIYQITTSENQKNNENRNISTIDLGKCETILKDKYNIASNLTLIIFKIDYQTPELLIPIIGYEVYHPINKSKLNLSHCEENLIKLNLPAKIDESKLFIHDPNSSYYTDYCFSYTTEDGTDILLFDRQQEYNTKNLSLCQKECNYLNYNFSQKKSVCQCIIKNKLDLISEIIDEPDKLSSHIFPNETSSNIFPIDCAKNLFTKDGLKKNISSYILSIIIFIFIFSILLFIKCGYPRLEDMMNEIMNSVKKESKKNGPISFLTHGDNNKIINSKHKNKRDKKCSSQIKLQSKKQKRKNIRNMNRIHSINLTKNNKISSGSNIKFQ